MKTIRGISVSSGVAVGAALVAIQRTQVIRFPVTPGHIGRELAAWFKQPFQYPQEKFRGNPTAPARPDLLRGVKVTAPGDCPLYTAHVITGVRIGPSPSWLQERLRAVGLRPINNVVDVGNYVMLETGQPLHAFDARRLGGAEIHVRRAAAGEAITTLDGKERKLDAEMLVIADATRPVVIAGIMGGQDSGVAADTTDLVLECAVFRRQAVRATSRRLALASDSSYRYERGVDPHGAIEAAWRAITRLDAPLFYLSGPPQMLMALSAQLREHQIAPEDIRTDAWE